MGRPMGYTVEGMTQRDAELVMLYSGGATLEEIGQAVGLTRERVRQRIRRAGYKGKHTSRRADPVRICRAAETATSLVDIAKDAGVSQAIAITVLQSLGKWQELRERWRVQRDTARREAALDHLKRLADTLGHTPNIHEINAADGPAHTIYYRLFGSLTMAQEIAGLEPNRIGGGNQTVTDEDVARMVRLREEGKSLSKVAVATGYCLATVERYLRKVRENGATPSE